MRNTYSLELRAVCPVNGAADLYEASIESSVEIRVEEILSAAEEIAKAPPRTQEEWALWLANRFNAKVRLAGYHSSVWVVSEAP